MSKKEKSDKEEPREPKGKEPLSPLSEETLRLIAEKKKREEYEQESQKVIGGIEKLLTVIVVAIFAVTAGMWIYDEHQESVKEKQENVRRADAGKARRAQAKAVWENCVLIPPSGSISITAKPDAPTLCYRMEYRQTFRFGADSPIRVHWINGKKTDYVPGTVIHMGGELDNPAFRVQSLSEKPATVTVVTRSY